MTETRIKTSSIIENQLPQFVIEEFPLVSEFLSQYYISLESQGNAVDLLENIDKYIKIDNLSNLVETTTLTSDVDFIDSTINVETTYGFPDSYGLLLIDSEIITYTSKSSTTFNGCVRGFSGNTSYEIKDNLVFSESNIEEHISGSTVTNLSILFLKQFLNKVKKQITPGFENRELFEDLNENLFIKQSIDFYSSKGTDNSFKILFAALYGQEVEIIKPRDFLIQPSSAQYRITADLVVEAIEGNPEDLLNKTLYQDNQSVINSAQGTITKIEKIKRDNKDYYLISLDFDYDKDIQTTGSIFGEFSIHPKTRLVSQALEDSETLEVDSTVGFPSSGDIIIDDINTQTSLNISYTSKTINQFLGCSGISKNIEISTEVKSTFFAYGYNSNNNLIKIRILGVLSELEIPNDTKFYTKNDVVKIKTFGIDLKDNKSNNWFYNLSTKYEVKSIELLDISDKSYKINLYDEHIFKVGDSATLISSESIDYTGNVISYNNKNSFTIQFGSNYNLLNENISYIVRRNLSKAKSANYPEINQYTSNIQNVYTDKKSLYVAAPSLPTYLDNSLQAVDRSIEFSGSFSPDDENDLDIGTTIDIKKSHGLYSGDAIVYNPTSINSLGIATGIYFVKKIDQTKIKLARSKSNIFNEKFISINSTAVDVKFQILENTYDDLTTRKLEPQKLIRKISDPETDGKNYNTKPGLTGIFINGVEIINYKSKDKVYYGPIQKIIPSSQGFGYDIINPPNLSINDPIGFGATAYCSIIGSLEKIDIIDPGFDYLEEPFIKITGGNGFGAIAKANLVSFEHEVSFNSSSPDNVKLNPTNTIVFSDLHKFRDFEEIIFITNGQQSISGIVTNSSYFISVEDAYSIKLYKSYKDASSSTNPIQLTSYGIGKHTIKSKNKKKKVQSITIESVGYNYQNKLTTTEISGINTSSNSINIKNHGYSSGEIIIYTATDIPVGGLSSSTGYYVTKISEDEFKLSQIGISTLGITSSFYYDSKQFINLTSSGIGIHKFNYPQIKVEVLGKIGVSTFAGSNEYLNATVQPVFVGGIQSVHVSSGGFDYGSEEIINYNRQPIFELSSGSGIELTPVVSSGKITNVLIKSSGSNYTSPPNLVVQGDGNGAILTPIMSNGTLVEVKVISGGLGYKQENTSINALSRGSGAKFESEIKSWSINLIERLLLNSQIKSDDSILVKGTNPSYGLQYSHGFIPKSLRSSVQGIKFKDGEKVYVQDLQIIDGVEIPSTAHSPIVGWAYDGNPIYGPYGYSSSGEIRPLLSGYEKLSKENNPNRPNTSLYPNGFFVEDFIFTENGDLDEHNGKFSITPEYPNGVYAYYCTINPNLNIKNPVFPYIIGNSYKSKPVDFNFNSFSNQDYIDINQTNWCRNTTPYNISTYEYLFSLNKINIQNSIIKNISKGFIDSVGIVTAGKNYKIGDKLIFDNQNLNVTGAKVSLIKGKPVNQINSQSTTIFNVSFYPEKNNLIGFTTLPHNLNNGDLITFTGKYDYKKSGIISINSNILSLTTGVAITQYTGIVTYFNISGKLNYPSIKENDIYRIGDEEVKVLNVDSELSRIRVIRNQNGTVGLTSYLSGQFLIEKSNKFKINFGISTSYNFDVDREFYFNPAESIGLGTNYGVGIVSTLYFSNPGAGITQIIIPTRSIYIKNHKLNTGDSLIYSSNGGSQISISTDGISSYQLSNNSTVYVAKLSDDLIGISTYKVGLSSIGTFVGIGSTQNKILYFTSNGTGTYHSFKTAYTNKLEGQISKNTVTVSVAETHGLSLNDEIIINVKSGISTTYIVKYDDYNRRLIINPRSFSSIDIENSIIEIENHNYYTGQKIIYTSTTPSTGLVNKAIYYVVVIDSNKIKLSNSYYSATNKYPEIVNILSSQPGVISPINPPLNLINSQSITFDLSDTSLSFLNNSIYYSAFDLKFYLDENLTEEFYLTPGINISSIGKIGVSSTANITLTINDTTPNNFYYSLIPVNLNLNSQVKKEIIVDKEVFGNNQITILDSKYNGKYNVVGYSSTEFTYNILEIPETNSYSNNVEYYTNSSSANGPIEKILLSNYKKKYSEIPNITSIISNEGSGAILLSNSNSIGKVLSTEIEDIGFDYSSDYSVRPYAKFPDILELEILSTFDYIEISSFGKNYTIVPDLVVFDGLTNKIIQGLDLSYSNGDSKVSIIKNSNIINNTTPRIIPINNSNGIKIKNISFNSVSKDVTVTLDASFSTIDDYPFEVGGKVLIEGVSVGINTDGKGYNSSNYNYSLFTVTGIDPNIGGSVGIVTYSLSSYLSENENPGSFNNFYSSGKIIPESYFPIFNPILKKNTFYDGEVVYTQSGEGTVESWNPNRQYLKVSTTDDFAIGQFITGKTSNSVAYIKDIIRYSSNYKINSYSPRRKGWNNEIGFLNSDFQRLHDNDYYQYFSYDIRSKKDLNVWNDAVSALNHTSGFKKFSNLIIESTQSNIGIQTVQNFGDFVGTADLYNTVDVNCVYDFDLVRENNLTFTETTKSDEIIFNSKIVQDYIESIGNRVLMIDDISNYFNSNPRSTDYSSVDSFPLSTIRSSKYIINIQDSRFNEESQISLVSLIHSNNIGFINQYGLHANNDLGYFDFSVSESSGNLLFYPIKEKINDYNLSVFSFSLDDVSSGVGTISLGDTVTINTNSITIPQGTSSPYTIVGISSTNRSSKVIVQIGSSSSSYFELNELTFIHDNNEVYLLEYGEITTSTLSSNSSSGIGTYNAYILGTEIKIDLIPNTSTTIDYIVNTFNISIANSSYTGVGTEIIGGTLLNSTSNTIPSSPSPISNIVSSYSNDTYNGSYSIMVVEDLTNLDYQVSEFLTITNTSNSYLTEFGTLYSSSPLGITTLGVIGSSSNLYFTPNSNINVSVKVFQVNMGLKNEYDQLNLI